MVEINDRGAGDGESEIDEIDGWKRLVRNLYENGGVPKQRARAVALVDAGYTYDQAASELGLEGENRRGQIAVHIDRYRQQDRVEAGWLVDHGPEV